MDNLARLLTGRVVLQPALGQEHGPSPPQARKEAADELAHPKGVAGKHSLELSELRVRVRAGVGRSGGVQGPGRTELVQPATLPRRSSARAVDSGGVRKTDLNSRQTTTASPGMRRARTSGSGWRASDPGLRPGKNASRPSSAGLVKSGPGGRQTGRVTALRRSLLPLSTSLILRLLLQVEQVALPGLRRRVLVAVPHGGRPLHEVVPLARVNHVRLGGEQRAVQQLEPVQVALGQSRSARAASDGRTRPDSSCRASVSCARSMRPAPGHRARRRDCPRQPAQAGGVSRPQVQRRL